VSSENEYKKLLIIGTLIGLLGSLALIIGIFFDFFTLGVEILDLAILTLVFAIFILCLLTFFGALRPTGFGLKDERPSLFALVVFILAPTLVVSNYNTPMYYLLEAGNDVLLAGTAGAVNFIGYSGIALMIIAFILLSWIFFYKNRFGAKRDAEETVTGSVKFLRILTSILAIVSGVGMILGMTLTITTTASAGLFMAGGLHFDIAATGFLIFIVGMVITAVLVLLSNLGAIKASKNEMPLLAIILIIVIAPGYAPDGTLITTWSTPVFKLLEYTSVRTGELTFMGWILVISILISIAAFTTGIFAYFRKTHTQVTPTMGSFEPKRRRRKSALTGPPSAATGPPSGSLASQLASQPPSAAQPSVPTAQTGPPSFMPSGPPSASTPTATSPAATAEKPTCPFCGKELSYIDEYQRWYCYSCQQYV